MGCRRVETPTWSPAIATDVGVAPASSLRPPCRLEAGAIGLLGLGMDDVHASRPSSVERGDGSPPWEWDTGSQGPVGHLHLPLRRLVAARQLRPEARAPDDIRGEFKPIATSTPGISICEHLPLLASGATSGRWSAR